MRSRAQSNVLSALLIMIVAIAAVLSQPEAAGAAEDEVTISGRITVPTGFEVVDVRVRAHPEGTQGVTSYDDVEGYPGSDGSYTLAAPPGRYKLEFDYMNSAGDLLVDQWYPAAVSEDAGSWVTVVAGRSQTIDAAMQEATDLGTIRGSVTWPNGTPAADTTVRLWTPNEFDDWDSLHTQRLGADGTYAFRMRPGTYLVQVDDGPYLQSQFWGGTGVDDATRIALTTGSTSTADLHPACRDTCATAAVDVPADGPRVGQTVAATTQGWNPSGTTGYVWMRDGSTISGAAGASYTLTGADLGTRISVRVVDNASMGPYPYVEASLTSPRTAAVAAAVVTPDPTPEPVPAVTGATPSTAGTARVGSTLTASAGTWTPASAKLALQWLRDGSPIAGAQGRTYVPTRADVNRSISVRVTGTATGHTPTTRASAPRKVLPAVSATSVGAKAAKRSATLTIRVRAAVTPTGKVTVRLGSRTVASGTLRNGAVVLRATRLAKGQRTLTIVYAGGNGVAGSSARKTVRVR